VRALLLGSTLLCLLSLVPSAPAVAGESASQPVRRTLLQLDEERLAVGGYDVVSYFTPGAPVVGSAEHTVRWRGGRFRFASAEHAATFKADPEPYAPRFGGYCAWAVSRGYVAKGDPTVWAVVEGRLYFNYDPSVAERWKQDPAGNIRRAEANWPGVVR